MRLYGEYLGEIIDNLRRNKLRTLLTGFAVAWGIVFLVILLGVGIGLYNGSKRGMDVSMSDNYGVTVQVWMTSLPYKGYQAGRFLYMTEPQMQQLKRSVPAIEDITPEYNYWGRASKSGRTEESFIKGIGGNYFGHFAPNVNLLAGRRPNANDVAFKNKVILINSDLAGKLFLTDKYDECIGQTLSIDDVSMTVIGVAESEGNSGGSCYMPSSTFCLIFPYNAQHINMLKAYAPSVRSKQAFEAFQSEVKNSLSRILLFSPEDDCLWMWSDYMDNESFHKVINGFYTFLWLVGLSTLLIGIIGVSNIMLVSVRERYKEIGIRKALGAKPRDIISMVLLESLLITSVSGCIGLIVSVGILGLGDFLLRRFNLGSFEVMGQTLQIFSRPIITPEMAAGILAVMIVSGLLAGYTPAKRAVRISVTEAMRD